MSCSTAPSIELSHLDHLWFQVAGTRCNLTCKHCFISCSPHNDTFGFMTLEQVQRWLDEAVQLGVKEYYFTGGEPFLNPDMVPILVSALRCGITTVLTNGTVLKDRWLETLREADEQSPYKLEFRVSIDGFSPETNDPIRGAGTFHRAMRGVTKLVQFGFQPIITATRSWPEQQEQEVVGQFLHMLRQAGYCQPRLKILPALRLGAEQQRSGGYSPCQRVDESMMCGFDKTQLVCEHSRMVTDRGVFVCPILIESPDALLGQTLQESLVPYRIKHGACYTCYQYGAICSNSSCGTSTTACTGAD